MRFLTVGDCAISVEFGNKINPETNNKIIVFNNMIKDSNIDGII